MCLTRSAARSSFPEYPHYSKSVKVIPVFCWWGMPLNTKIFIASSYEDVCCRLRRQGFGPEHVRRERVPPLLCLPCYYGPPAQQGLSWCIYTPHPAPASVSLSLGGNFVSENRSPGGFGSAKHLQCSCSLVVNMLIYR